MCIRDRPFITWGSPPLRGNLLAGGEEEVDEEAGPTHSSPIADDCQPELVDLSPVNTSDRGDSFRDFVFLPTARNTHRAAAILAARAPAPVPPEPNHWTNAVWKRKRVRIFKYVDDGISVEKANYENADKGESREEVLGPDGEMEEKVTHLRLKHAVGSENAFNMTSATAQIKGMKVNTAKQMCTALGTP